MHKGIPVGIEPTTETETLVFTLNYKANLKNKLINPHEKLIIFIKLHNLVNACQLLSWIPNVQAGETVLVTYNR